MDPRPRFQLPTDRKSFAPFAAKVAWTVIKLYLVILFLTRGKQFFYQGF